jgi:hypothetical protein
MKSALFLVAVAAVLVLVGCGSGTQSSSPTLNVSGEWRFTTFVGGAGTVTLNQQDSQVTGTLNETGYYGSVPGIGLPSIAGTLNGTTFQATITGTYGPYGCGDGVINIDIAIDLTGTVAVDGNSMSGTFMTRPSTCFDGNSGSWMATRISS